MSFILEIFFVLQIFLFNRFRTCRNGPSSTQGSCKFFFFTAFARLTFVCNARYTSNVIFWKRETRTKILGSSPFGSVSFFFRLILAPTTGVKKVTISCTQELLLPTALFYRSLAFKFVTHTMKPPASRQSCVKTHSSLRTTSIVTFPCR